MQVGARLADLIGMTSPQRRVFGVRQIARRRRTPCREDATTICRTVGLRRQASRTFQVPATFVSNVGIGLRFAMPTTAWAARWKTVSHLVLVHDALEQRAGRARPPARPSPGRQQAGPDQLGVCGTQSRTRHTTSAPASRRRLHQPTPEQAGGSRHQNEAGPARTPPHSHTFQGALFARPRCCSSSRLSRERVHTLPEAVVTVGQRAAHLPASRSSTSRSRGCLVALEVVEHARVRTP